jgi:hypothetical protein
VAGGGVSNLRGNDTVCGSQSKQVYFAFMYESQYDAGYPR